MSEEIHTDFGVAFTDGLTLADTDGARCRTRVVQLGELVVASGAVALGDPATGLTPTRPPSGAIAVGSYPVDLGLAETLDDGGFLTKGDVRSTAARVRFGEGTVDAWIRADISAGVDSGTCGFTDGDAYWEPSDDASERIDDALQDRSYGPSVGAVRHVAPDGRVVFAFSSGLGDGVYSAYWGVNGVGEPMMLCLDFAVLIRAETHDVALPWPLGRGAVDHAELRKYEVSARVPWLAPNELRLRWTDRKPVLCARWRHPDGRLTRMATTSRGRNALTVSLADRPADASLVVRMLLGEVPMRPSGGAAPIYR